MSTFALPGDAALWLIDGLLAWVAVEALVLVVRHRRTGGGLAPRDVCWNLIAGAWLMAALRSALAGHGLGAIALCLAGAGVCHAVDLRLRMRQSERVQPLAMRERALPRRWFHLDSGETREGTP